MTPFIARLDASLAQGGDATALLFPDSPLPRLTYAQLGGCVARLGSRIAARGLAQGSLVSIELTNGLLHGAAILACLKLGLPTVSAATLPPGMQERCALRLVDSPDPTAPVPPQLAIGPGLLRDDPATAEPRWAAPGPDDLCRVMTTSGSTGRPKPVLLTYAMVEGRLVALAEAFGDAFSAEPALLCAMPYGTSLGYAFFLERIARGGLFCGESLDFARLSRTVAAERIGALVTTPHTLGEYAAHLAQHPAASLPRIPLVLTAGSRLAPSLAAELGRRFAGRLVSFYGTTECGVVATQRCEGDPPWPLRIVANRAIEIVDEAGAVLPAGATGRVRIRATSGPVPFVPGFGVTQGPDWFEPGDLGHLEPDGALAIAGRSDNVLNAGGSKMLAEDLEEIIARAPGVVECGVAALADTLGIPRIVCGLVRRAKWQQQPFMDYCERSIHREFLPAKFVILRAIPRTPTRKIDRRALAELLAKN